MLNATVVYSPVNPVINLKLESKGRISQLECTWTLECMTSQLRRPGLGGALTLIPVTGDEMLKEMSGSGGGIPCKRP